MRQPWGVVVLVALSTAVLADEKTIEPGLYEVTTKSSLGPTTTAKQCLTAKDFATGLTPVLEKNCKSVRSVVSGGKLDFATTCPDLSMTMTGSYTATSYTIDGKVTMKGDDDPTVIESHIAAKRVAASC